MSADKIPKVAAFRGRAWKRLGLTATTSAALTGFYCLYALAMRPVVETPGLGPRTSFSNEGVWAPARPRQGEEMAIRYLPSQPWAEKAKYILRTEEAFIYFEEWEPIDEDKAVRFTPFAMVYMKKSRKPDEEPITVISDSAYVRFVNKFSLTSSNAGRVINAALEGSALIEGDKGMRVQGHNFVFSEKQMRIWSYGHVDFNYGPHKGNGHELQVDLIPDEVARAENKLAVKGFRTVRLRRNVLMDLEFREGESGPLFAQNSAPPLPPKEPAAEVNTDEETPPFATEAEPAQPAKESKKTKEPKEPTIVKVRSAGSFEFQVDANIAIFEDEVRVYQPTEPGKYNSLQSDLMTLYFEPKEKTPKPGSETPPPTETTKVAEPPAAKPAGEESFKSVDSNLTFRRLVAVGKNVILRSETNNLIAMMHHLDYDAKSRLVKMTSRDFVRVLQKQSEMQCPLIELLHQAGGEVSHLWAKGAGWLKSVDEKTGKLAFAAQWKKELRKLPDPRTGLNLIELEQEALVRQPEDQFGLAAEFMRLWLEQEEKTKPESPGLVSTDSPDDKQESSNSSRMQPKRLLALKNVAIVSPQMQGQSQRLEIWFEPAPVSAPLNLETADTKRPRTDLEPAVKQVPNPPATKDPAASDPAAKKKSDDGPIEVVADLIKVKVLTHAGKRSSDVSEIWTEGRVDVRQAHAKDVLPLHMTGDRLHVLNRAKDDQLMTLWGSPGHVRDRGMHIEGRDIFLDRRKNFSRVNGEGLLQLPVKRSLEGEEMQEAKPLDVWWTEQMTFDGLNAKFFGNVRAILNNDGMRNNMRCEEMNVLMTNRISFTENLNENENDPHKKDRPKAEISRVECKDGVEFDSYKYEETKLTEIRRGHFAEFALNQITGDSKGQGPGEIKVWRRGRGKRAGMTPNASVKANRALKPDTSEWEYMRIEFAGLADGNLKQKFNTFRDRVQIIYGPVERSLMVIQRDEVKQTKDAGAMSCENLRLTQRDSAQKEEPAHVELLGTGNVKLEGNTFNARADSVSFDESKGLYTLRSQGSRKATIWRQTQVGGNLSQADAHLMHFIPSRNILKLDRAVGLDGVN